MRPGSQRRRRIFKNYVQRPNWEEAGQRFRAYLDLKMTQRPRQLALLAAAMSVLPAWGNCTLPRAPSKVPDGSVASQQEMISAMQTLKHYDTDVGNYVKCLEFEANQNRLSRADQARQHNAAIEGLQAIAAKFNEQVRVFKAKNG